MKGALSVHSMELGVGDGDVWGKKRAGLWDQAWPGKVLGGIS